MSSSGGFSSVDDFSHTDWCYGILYWIQNIPANTFLFSTLCAYGGGWWHIRMYIFGGTEYLLGYFGKIILTITKSARDVTMIILVELSSVDDFFSTDSYYEDYLSIKMVNWEYYDSQLISRIWNFLQWMIFSLLTYIMWFLPLFLTRQ